MKKIDLSWTEKVIDRVSKLDFLLVEVALLLVVFVVVNQSSRDVVAYETRELASMTVAWEAPTGYASFIDSGSKQKFCTGTGTSCTTEKYAYWPGSPLYYSVKVGNREGAVIKSGSTSADSLGRGKATWSWKYATVVWPTNFSSCEAAKSECMTATNLTNRYYTFGALKPNTDYRVIVCAPDCGTGTKIVDRIQKTAIPAKLNPVGDASMTCASATSVTVNFGWTAASGGVYDRQVIDLSVNEFFAAGYTQTVQLSVGQVSYQALNLAPGTKYYWRINNRLGYSAEAWVTSPTGVFTTKSCNLPPVITCEMADVNRDGIVNSIDYVTISRYKTLAYDPRYDLDKNGKVDDADVLYAASKAGTTCSSAPYAVKLTQNATCSSLTVGDVVRVEYKWQVGVGSTQQYLDFDIAPHGDTGWPTSTAVPLDATASSRVLDGFAQDVTYYWRINTKGANGVWSSSAMKSFKTPKCYLPAEPKDLKVTVSATSKKADGTICTDTTYGVNFSWTGQGQGWALDISNSDPNFAKVSTRDVSTRTSLLTTGSDFNPALTFDPGKTYWWRMYSPETGKWYTATLPAFLVDYCTTAFLNELPDGWPVASGIVSQGPNGGSSHGVLEALDITGGTGTPILASLDGVVADICIDGRGCDYGNLGNAVVVKNPKNNNLVIYGHLSSFTASAIGQNIKKGNREGVPGDVIGGMGCTGYCTGTHLHYEFRGLNMGTPYIPLGVAEGCNSETSCGVSW